MYTAIIDIFRQRKIFDRTAWKFAFKHKDLIGVKEFLSRDCNFKKEVGIYLDTKLLKVTPECVQFHHLDYFPLINSRAHKLGN